MLPSTSIIPQHSRSERGLFGPAAAISGHVKARRLPNLLLLPREDTPSRERQRINQISEVSVKHHLTRVAGRRTTGHRAPRFGGVFLVVSALFAASCATSGTPEVEKVIVYGHVLDYWVGVWDGELAGGSFKDSDWKSTLVITNKGRFEESIKDGKAWIRGSVRPGEAQVLLADETNNGPVDAGSLPSKVLVTEADTFTIDYRSGLMIVRYTRRAAENADEW
jgi:hypothetical protein